ncbi:type II toxin-antitoxin system Phd/YefM family antitoxin [Microbacterium sp.]|uniref:type II toxin-antitoxin system Phd/YefM family antitoxin n=1 Tax=Microbacterium sp. TaxID=51671 RepID=UPI0025CC4481|nr:type II toxin-antitoxin system Phd/YefM family antitoxin [Microbacterium sp.]
MATLDRELSSTELRDDITTVVSSVEHGHARIGVTRHGKLAAVVIGVEDLESRVA